MLSSHFCLPVSNLGQNTEQTISMSTSTQPTKSKANHKQVIIIQAAASAEKPATGARKQLLKKMEERNVSISNAKQRCVPRASMSLT